MARKDLRRIMEEAARHGSRLRVLWAVTALLDDAIARGDADMVAMAKV
jgi:hypothetical protein